MLALTFSVIEHLTLVGIYSGRSSCSWSGSNDPCCNIDDVITDVHCSFSVLGPMYNVSSVSIIIMYTCPLLISTEEGGRMCMGKL